LLNLLKILIVYYQESNAGTRNTIEEHLRCFERYSGHDCYYLNVAAGVPRYIDRIPFNIVIYHYTFCVCRNFRKKFHKQLIKWAKLKRVSGHKIAIPQDEYLNTDILCKFFKEYSIEMVFTCLPESEWEKVYPQMLSGVKNFVTVLTGYVDELSLKRVSKYINNYREIDVGYRARKVPYYLGRHGCLKWKIAEKFIDACKCRSLKLDISTDMTNDVLLGDDWYKFLSRCRTVLGCEGGSSLLDFDGTVRACVDDYMDRKPEASYSEVERECFPGMDGNLKLFAVSPRHFESCITRTCQILIEGEYAGIFKPGVHYIEIKKDWSNLEHVIKQISDHALCKRIAETAYADIIGSGLYTYRKFVQMVIDKCSGTPPLSVAKKASYEKFLNKLVLRERNISIYLLPYRIKYFFHEILRRMGLFEKYILLRQYGLNRLFSRTLG
jgi:hypothetical protein